MLTHLYIKNYALIDLLEMDFQKGFSVITGETGAGKSIILGAISLILGQRAEQRIIKNTDDKCIIEAWFTLDNSGLEHFFKEHDIDYDSKECILRRELTASGKSRAFINDTPVPLSVMKYVSEKLVDIHSQHQNLLLQKEDFQLMVVDVMADNGELISEYRNQYEQLLSKRNMLDEKRALIEQNRNEEDFIRFRYQELADAHLCDGELEELEREQNTLEHAEDIKSALCDTDKFLNNDECGIVSQAKRAVSILRQIENVYPSVTTMADRLESVYIELKDLALEVCSMTEDIEYDPRRLETITARLDTLYTLLSKFKVNDVKELISVKDSLEERLQAMDNSDEDIAILVKEVEDSEKACMVLAHKLSERRRKASVEIERQILQSLVPLGIPHARFNIEFKSKELADNGIDKVQYLFSANSSSPLSHIANVASGGEVARVMLSLKAMISKAVSQPTIIFDEIDTGVSGKIASSMAAMMRDMGNHDRQVISITHLPQIAAMGAVHYKVYKEEKDNITTTHLVKLNDDDRVKEIAIMLSGDNITEAAINNAKELLK